MKKELMFLLCFLITAVCVSQRKKALYLSSELELGNYLGVGADLNYIYKDKYSLSIGAQAQLSIPTNLPGDYDSGDNLPFTELTSIVAIRVLIGRVFYFDSKRLSRLNLQLGISSNTIETPVNWKKNETASNGYSYVNYSNRSIGCLISPSIEFPLFNIIGFKVAPKVHFTEREIFVGVGLGILLGDLK